MALTILDLKRAVIARDAEITRLRCALADVEALAETLAEAQRMASDALAPPAAHPSECSKS